MLEQVKIVLVEASHPGNIGAAARAMKNMGLSQLVLVNPYRFPHGDATVRAAGADDILQQARCVDSLQAAIQDCHVVIGTSARSRALDCVTLNPRAVGELIQQECEGQQVALLFGRERVGLTNQELECCHYRLNIPANPVYSSLNLAQAVQVVCYELRMAANLEVEPSAAKTLVSAEVMAQFYQHLETTLVELEFLKPENPGLLMRKLRRIFNRAGLDQKECNMLRGVWSAAQGRKIDYLKQAEK